MEILRISKHAIRISLSTEEAKEYKILKDASLDDENIKFAFARLLDKAESEVDFSYAGRKIFTEIFPSKDGGCEIFISCIGMEDKEIVYKDKQQLSENKKSKAMLAIFDFDCFEKLLNACYRLNEIKYKKRSSVYYSNDNKHYFMVLEDVYIKDLKFAFLQEYAKYIKGNILSFLKEHYACIIKKEGVKVLSALA